MFANLLHELASKSIHFVILPFIHFTQFCLSHSSTLSSKQILQAPGAKLSCIHEWGGKV